MSEVSKHLSFINFRGDEITWKMVITSEEDTIDAVSSDDRVVSIFNATSIGVGSIGTGGSALVSESIWFDVITVQTKGFYENILLIRKLIEDERLERISKNFSYKAWYKDAITLLALLIEEPEYYEEYLQEGFEQYFGINNTKRN